MQKHVQTPDVGFLRSLSLFADTDVWKLQAIADSVEPLTAKKGQVLIERGTDDGFTYFLGSGEVQLDANDGQVRSVEASPEVCRTPLANLRPRMFQVKALGHVEAFRIPDVVISAAGVNGQPGRAQTILVEDSDEAELRELQSELGFRLYRDLQDDKTILPSLPDLALRIQKAVSAGSTDARDIARIVETDPAITAKLVKVANSALYGGRSAVETCAAAIVRLGTKTTQKLVMTYSVREVFKPAKAELREKMHGLWEHCADVAAISFVLARYTGTFDPEEAMLAGLVHDVGTIAILNYANTTPELNKDLSVLEGTVARLRGELSAMILRKWSFPPEIVAASREAENWTRVHDRKPDFADLIIVAQVHDTLCSGGLAELPPFAKIAPIARILGDDADPETSLSVIKTAQMQIAETRALLGD